MNGKMPGYFDIPVDTLQCLYSRTVNKQLHVRVYLDAKMMLLKLCANLKLQV